MVGVAHEAGLRLHMDGARLMNAVVASGAPAASWTAGFDTAWVDFSKGLGAPVGACLAGSRALIDEAWRYKQMWGGAMRQAGIIAAGALYALDHHVERLADDHALARELAGGLAAVPGVALDPAAVTTNIVVFGVDDAPALVAALRDAGVKMGALGPRTVRAVTHLDVDARRRRARDRGGPRRAQPRRRRIASATRSALSGVRSAARRRSLADGPTRCSISAARSGGAAR